MSARKCAREECGKTVYPLEELKCLDKVWHKQCFKCTVCGMTLNMKNYKGYDKMPYCEPHYPKTVASVVTDTPEMRRVAENTRNQSQVQYHAAYEKSKGTKIDVADDPEMERHRKNMQAQSQVAYTGELDKRKKMEEVRPNFVPAEGSGEEKAPPAKEPVEKEKTPPAKAPVGKEKTPPAKSPAKAGGPAPATAKAGGPAPATAKAGGPAPTGKAGLDRVVCSPLPTSDLPYANVGISNAGQHGNLSTLVYSSDNLSAVQQPHQQRVVGSIADYDPLNGSWGTVASSRNSEKIRSEARYCVDFAEEIGNRTASMGSNAKLTPSGNAGFAVKAIYDYTAADKDEVSFVEGDIIVNCEKVDDGWMTGTVQRTLQWGMLPANYVQPHKLPTGLARIK